MKLYDEYDQDELRELLIAQYKRDCDQLIAAGHVPLPWTDSETPIPQDQGKLLMAIADNGGGWPLDYEAARLLLGFVSRGNAKAVVNALIRNGMAENNDGLLDLTELGRQWVNNIDENPADFPFLWQ